MKTLLVLFTILIILLSGCGVFNLGDFVLPDDYDIEFIKTVKTLNTPEKICNYMDDNFTYFCDPNKAILSPYQSWLIKEVDCDDMSTFATSAANYHNYPAYQIYIYFKGTLIYHALAIYLENDKYTYSSNQTYYPLYTSSFNDIVLDYFKHDKREINYYEIFDYNMDLIEKIYAS